MKGLRRLSEMERGRCRPSPTSWGENPHPQAEAHSRPRDRRVCRARAAVIKKDAHSHPMPKGLKELAAPRHALCRCISSIWANGVRADEGNPRRTQERSEPRGRTPSHRELLNLLPGSFSSSAALAAYRQALFGFLLERTQTPPAENDYPRIQLQLVPGVPLRRPCWLSVPWFRRRHSHDWTWADGPSWPRGVAAPAPRGLPDSEQLFQLAAVVVVVCLLAHSPTDQPMASWLQRGQDRALARGSARPRSPSAAD